MGVIRKSFEDGIRGLSNTSSSNDRKPDIEAANQTSKLRDYVSRPLGAGQRSSSLTSRLGDSSRSVGGQLAQSLRISLARASTTYRADSAISGSRVGTNNLTGAPLANESGSATIHQGLATGSNVTPIRIPAPKADLPGIPAILTRGSPLLGNRQVLMAFLKSNAFGGGSNQGSSINTNSIPLEDNCNPSFISVNFEVNNNADDDNPPPSLPPEDQGGSPLEPDEPPPPPVNFNCTPTGCVASSTGIFDTLPECEAQCQQRYTCKNGTCVPDPNGNHANLSLCLNACQSRYTCVQGTCVSFPTGGFATLVDCVEACSQPRWDCVAGECTLTDPSGAFATAAECRASDCNCTPTGWSMTIVLTPFLNEPSIGCSPAGNTFTIYRNIFSKTPPEVFAENIPGAPAKIMCRITCAGADEPFPIFSFGAGGCGFQIISVDIVPI